METNKELELEAEKYNKNAPLSEMYLDKAFIAGATSKWVEKQKLEFAIEQLKKCSHAPTIRLGVVIEELEQKLSEL